MSNTGSQHLYFASFYSYDHPAPKSSLVSGLYDIGCGGNCEWYIIDGKIPADNFCVPYPNGRYALILQLYAADYNMRLFLDFVKRYPIAVQGNELEWIAFSNSPNITPEMFNSEDGCVIAVDLEALQSTYTFSEETGQALSWDCHG